MKTLKTTGTKSSKINFEAFKRVIEDHKKINKLIESGKDIDPELSKNFVSFPLSDNVYNEL